MSKDSPLTRNKCMDTSKLTTSIGIPVKGIQAVLKAHLRAHPAPAELYLFLRGAPQVLHCHAPQHAMAQENEAEEDLWMADGQMAASEC